MAAKKKPEHTELLKKINTGLSAAILVYCVSIEHRLTVLETLATVASVQAKATQNPQK